MIIDGRELSRSIREELRIQIKSIKNEYIEVPHLVVVLIGEDPASKSYVKAKERACKEVGIRSTLIKLESTISENDLLKELESLNKDDNVHGILVQLPLPKHISQDTVIDFLEVSKDVDGLTPTNISRCHTLRYSILPCTPKGIITMLKSKNIPIAGKHAVVIGRSNLVGKPIAQLLLKENASVSITHRHTEDLAAITKQADILVSAVGIAKFVTKEMVKKGAVCIDVGLSRVDGKLCGDFDFDNLLNHVAYISKAPGGVGPMTITSLLENTIECFLNQKNNIII
ncbi:Bifunctional protein FolD protein [Candidatus Izimaplasma bacterium HR1]|jgi:methylenetetrahydrofolate dehydrogenase (NADP+)/methenyltetrahydrofolate cyclohydrolase|uniref:bifunctional 5,10-methylenetetrahydrofolate dehydrogenase/5,10-methenyltetrahydrofolate cyclohydrolase n=1 Tax=Candidatus Izimoplasma sp. HR1 TaxID=1541959 RepID=UPI0004F7ECBD|nr:Bifunctional protein FolD protein [Candidatus Izimaplasma bacterium HR1]